MLIGGKFGLVDLTASDRIMSTWSCDSSLIMLPCFGGRPVSFLSFIKDAGVAGSLLMASSGADLDPIRWAARYGDLPAVADLGVAGGGIRASDNGSGDIDSASELSGLDGTGQTPACGVLAPGVLVFRASWIISATSFGGMTILFLLDCGFIAGDERTVRVGFRNVLAGVFLLDFRRGVILGREALVARSRLMSIGEFPTDVSE